MLETEVFILLGKALFRNSELDWVGEARCNMAIEQMSKNPDAKLIITGGKTTSEISEASVMADYIISTNPQFKDRIILEEAGQTTIHQLVIVKRNILIPGGFKKIGLITDETHLSRALLLAQYIFGDEYEVTSFSATLKISGYYRKAIETYENKMYELTTKNPVLLYCKKGDDEEWLKFDEFLRNAKSKKSANGQAVDVTDEYTKIIKKKFSVEEIEEMISKYGVNNKESGLDYQNRVRS